MTIDDLCGRCGHERFYHLDYNRSSIPCSAKDRGEQCHGFMEQVPDPIPGLELAVRIAESRRATAAAICYGATFIAALDEVLVFLRAELHRQRHPDQASRTTMDAPGGGR